MQCDEHYLSLCVGDVREHISGFARTRCPYCWTADGVRPHKKNFWVSTDSGVYGCWRCNIRGRLGDEDASRVARVPARVVDMSKGVSVPEGFCPVVPDGKTAPAYNYLRGRGVSFSTIQEACIGCVLWDSGAVRSVVVPVIDGGVVHGYVERYMNGYYRNPVGLHRGSIMFNMGALSCNTSEPLLVVEGVFDALPYWPHAAAFLGKPSSLHFEMVRRSSRRILVAMDADAQSIGCAFARKLAFSGVSAEYVSLPPGYDPNELYMSGWLVDYVRSMCPDAWAEVGLHEH